jgi:asparagine synthase (glutamine-hydrolysing)
VWAVPAGHYLSFFHGKLVYRRHWLPPEIGEIRYKNNEEYEARFFHLFGQSVRRRLEPRQGLVAQLSGGMDSTSIVCMADHICGMNAPKTDLIDTVSFYDASESGWDDDKYFPLVEAFRGKRGIHIPASGARFSLEPPPAGYALPGTNGSSEDLELDFIAAFGDKPCSTVLSGLGGDEFMGGIPDPTPELAAKLVRGEIKQLMSASLSWGLARRLPFVDLLVNLASFFRNSRSNQSRWVQKAPPWLIRERRKQVRNLPLREDSRRLSTLQTYAVKLLESVQETLPHQTPGLRFRPEYRYPILDRDLLDFLIGIPREQVVAPGERRSLMRRSLRTLLPPAILARRRKAAISQGPLRAMIAHRAEITRVFQGSWLASLGFVKGDVFQICLDRVASGQDLFLMPGLKRAIDMELWLQARISAGDLQI